MNFAHGGADLNDAPKRVSLEKRIEIDPADDMVATLSDITKTFRNEVASK